MIVKYINDEMPRTDNVKGKPTGVTLLKEYTVVDVSETHYSILNDNNKLARYAKERFVISENSSIPSIRDAFNSLTSDMRKEIKELKEQIAPKSQLIRPSA